MRLGFSVAMHVQPDVLLLDEVLAVGDEAFQQKCYGRIGDFKRGGGTIVFVSHDPSGGRADLRPGDLARPRPLRRDGHRRRRGPRLPPPALITAPASAVAHGGAAGRPRSRIHEVRAVAGDGAVRDRFTEGEPMALEVWLYAEQGLDGRQRDGRPPRLRRPAARVADRSTRSGCGRSGWSGCGCTSPGCRCGRGASTSTSASRPATATPSSPMRRARARAQRLRPGPRRGGAIRLGGTWELPAVDGTSATGNVNRMEPLLVRAARREPVERTPVWFMRQAGRSLPEYRELRKQYGLFEIARQPELCAEVTLQPVRRHDVDAAVMFADIMLPVLGMGVEVELVENVGPVVAVAGALARRRRAAGRARAGGVGAVDARVGAARARGAARRPGGRRLRRRPVHGRGLPDRGQALARVQADEGVHVLAARGLARADGEARRGVRPVRGRLRRGRGGRDPAVRLLGRRPLGRRLPRVRRALLGARARGGRRADDPLRDRRRAPARGAGGRRRRRDRRRLARPARRRLGAGRPRPRHPGEPRRRRPARARGSGSRRAPGACSSRQAAGPGTSSTSATACCRRPTPSCLAGSSGSCTRRRWCRRERRGDPDGVRQPGDGRRHPPVLRGHPRRPARLGRGGRRAGRALPADRRALAARRAHRGAARGARARARDPGLRRDEALAAADRRGGRTARSTAGRRG